MNRIIYSRLLFLFLLISATANAQLPPYYNITPGSGVNSFPFAVSTGKGIQWLVQPGEFNIPSPAPGGNNITNIWFNVPSGVNATYSNFMVRLAQINDGSTDPNWTAAAWYTGAMTTVITPATKVIVSGTGGWWSMQLDVPFLYDPTKALIVEVTQCGYTGTGNTVYTTTIAGPPRRKYATPSSCIQAYVGQGTEASPIGLTLVPAGPCTDPPTPGTVAVNKANPVCPNTNFNLNLIGNSTGQGQTYQWQISPDSINWTNIGPVLNVSPLYTTSQVVSNYYRCQVTCGLSTVPTPGKLIITSSIPLNGTYTINNALPTSGTNFASFSALASALACSGVSGPITVNVDLASGPYNEQAEFFDIPGSSSTNTVTINGNGRTITSNLSSLLTNIATINLNGADYMTFNNLVITAQGATYGFAVHMMNSANNNTFNNCTINANTTTTSTTSACVSMSSSANTYSSTGINGSNNLFTGCTVTGGYFGFVFYGDGSSAQNNLNNAVVNCTIQDYYVYGGYNYYQGNVLYSRNIFQRLNRLAPSSTSYGILLTTGNEGALIEKNRIRRLWDAAPTSTGTTYCIYNTATGVLGNENKVYSNLVSDMNYNGTIYGMYFSGASNLKVYHNTISLDQTGATGTGTTTYGCYASSSSNVNIGNNIITISRGGTGTKYCEYFPGIPTSSNYNDLFITASSSNNIGYNGAATFATLSAWKTGNPTLDQQSVSVDPVYTAPATNDYTPTNNVINSICPPVGVSTDLINTVRSTIAPDPGAYEFTPVGIDARIIWSSPQPPVTAGLKTISVLVINTMTVPITDLNLSYTDGITPVTQSFTGLSLGVGGSQILSFSTPYSLVFSTLMRAYISSVNGIADNVRANDTTTTVNLCIALNGTYTLNSALPTGAGNFQTFSALATALNCGGVAGPVVVNVAAGSGPYNEQVEFTSAIGVSAVNTITINGNGTTLTQTLTGTPTNYVTLNLNGADYMTFNNLTVNALGVTYGYALHLMNGSDHNTFNGCNFNANTTGTGTTAGCVTMSGSVSSFQTTGVNGSFNLWNGCTTNGGYFGITFYGDGVSYLNNQNNSIVNCTIQNFYVYSTYNYYQGNSTFSGNIIQRPTRSTVSTGYGIMLTTGCQNILIEKNRIRKMWDGAPTSTGTTYCIYAPIAASLGNEIKINNNVISDINFLGTIYGMYLSGGTYFKIYHNTISLDQTTASGSGTTTYGIYSTGGTGVDIRNNIITVKRGGTATKYCIYYSPLPVTSNNNDLYMISGSTNYVTGVVSSNYSTLAAYQAANPTMDQQSRSAFPNYVSPGSGDYTPTAGSINNMCSNVGILTDITGSSRGANPDPGAYEFTPAPLDAICTWVAPVTPFSGGPNTITVAITNNASNTLTSLLLGYTDGTTTQSQSFTGLNIPTGQTQNFSFSTPYNIIGDANLVAYITQANGLTDADQTNDSAYQSVCLGLNGTYTINSAVATGGTNFQSFSAVAARLINCGISGPVVFNVAAGSGPYNEQFDLPAIGGTSSTNTITFNGNNRTITFDATSSAYYATINLSGADYLRFNNLNVASTGAANAYGIHFMNSSDNNIFTNVTVTVSTASTSTNTQAIVMNASNTVYSTGGSGGNNNTFNNCTFTGGYYGVVLYGLNVGQGNSGNAFFGCNFRESYAYSTYNLYTTNGIISGCIMERPTRTTTTTAAGGYFSTGCANMLVEKNRVRNMFGGTGTTTGTIYGFACPVAATLGNENRFYNNVISDINFAGTIYGLYLSGASYIKIYNNTISLDHTASTSTGTTYGIYLATAVATDIRNNIVSITRGGTGTKYGLYYSTVPPISDYNDVYVNAAAGTNYFGYNGANQNTLANWQAANPLLDQNTLNVNPLFANVAAGDYSPTNYSLDNSATPVGLTTDINGNPRSLTTPDIGAYEAALPPTTDFQATALIAPAPTGCFSSAETMTVRIKNNGNYTHDFSVAPVSVSCEVTGMTTATVTGSATGTLASKGLLDVTIPVPVDMSALGAYSIKMYVTATGDVNSSNDTATATRTRVAIAAGTLSVDNNKICTAGKPNLLLTGSAGGNIQWQQTTADSVAGPWTNVGSGGTTFTPASNITQTTYYRVQVSCLSTTVTTNVQTVLVSTPVLLSSSGASRCGIGPVTLTATANALSDVNWYTSRIGGTPVYTGNNFTVPSLSATTKYYVGAAFGGNSYHVGKVNIETTAGTGGGIGTYMIFDAYSSFTLKSVDIFPFGATQGSPGTVTVQLQNSSGTPLQTITVNATACNSTNCAAQTITLNFPITPGTGYRLVATAWTGGVTNLYRDLTGTYPYTLPGVMSITGPSLTPYYYFWYNWAIGSGCETPRDSVMATFTPAPPVTSSGSTLNLCVGANSVLTASSALNPSYTYTWQPGALTGSSVNVYPQANTEYVVTALDTTSGTYAGCQATDTVRITTKPKVSVVATADPVSICSGDNSQLAVSGSTSSGYLLSTQTPSPVTPPGSGVVTLNNTSFPGNTSGLDDGYFTVNLPFPFSYFGSNYSKVFINDNGYVSFGKGYDGVPSNLVVAIPNNTDPVNNAVYLAWKDWDLSVSGNIQYFTKGSAPHRVFVIKYNNVPPYVATPPYTGAGYLNGQIELYEDNGKIELFLSQTDASSTKTLGIENATGTAAYAPALRNGTAWSVASPEQFELLPNGGILTYSWSPASNLDFPSSTTPFASFIVNTTTYVATVSDAVSGCVGKDSVTIVTGDPLLAPIQATDTVICTGQGAILSVAPTGGCSPYSYVWDDGTSVLGNSNSIGVSPDSTKTYFLYVTDGIGNIYPQQVTITVHPTPNVTATPGLICGTGTASLTASGANTYTWSPSTSLNTTTGSTVVSSTTVTRNYTVTGTTALGCSDTAVARVTVSNPVQATASASNQFIGVGGSTQLTSSAIEVKPAANYYTLSSFTGIPYTTLSGPGITVINTNAQLTSGMGSTNEDDGGVVINLPFTFNYFGSSYTQMTMCTNGWVGAGNWGTIDAVTMRTAGNLFTSTIPNRTIAAWFKDMGANFPTGPGSMRHGLIGTDIYAFQWDKAVGSGFSDGSSILISFQVNIYGPASGTPGRIEIIYGQTIGTVAFAASIGIEDNIGGANHFLNALNGSTTLTTTSTAWPGAGKMYEFDPTPTSFTYSWSPSTFLNNSTIYNPLASGMTTSTTYTLTAANQDGCSATAMVPIVVGAPLVVSASSSGNNFCQGVKDTLRTNASGGCQPYTYSWSDGTNVIGTSANVNFTPPAGTNTYTVTVIDACSDTATASVTITVKSLPTVTVTKSNDICGSGSSTLTASGASSYTWSPTTGLNSSVGASVVATLNGSAIYTVTGTGPNSCNNTATIPVVVNAAVSTTPAASPSILCVGGTSQLNANATIQSGPATYYNMSSLTGQNYAPLSGAGITIINSPGQLLAGMGSVNEDDGGVVINLPFTFNYNGTSFTQMTMCTNGWVGAGNQGTIDAVSMRTAGNLFTSTIPNNTIAPWFKDMGANFPSGAGSMRHGLIGTDIYAFQWNNAVGSGFSDGSTITISFQVNIYGPASASPGRIEFIYGPTAGAIAFAASIGVEDATGGANHYLNALTGTGTSTITSTVWPGNGNGYRFDVNPPASLTYSWSPATFLNNTAISNPVASGVTGTTTYTSTVTNSSTGCVGTGMVTITAGVPLAVTTTAYDAITCSGDPDTLYSTVTGGKPAYLYSWSDGTSVIATTAKVSVHPLVTTSYTLTVTDNCGTITTATPVTITVNPLPVLVVTPPGGSICDGIPASITMTASGANTYSWSPTLGLSAATGAVVTATAPSNAATTVYTVTGTNTVTGCVNTLPVTVYRSFFTSGIATASPSVLCASDPSQLGAMFTVKTNPALLITEVTQFGAGATGATSPRPSYFGATDDDFVEISNLSDLPILVGGMSVELWTGAALNRTYTIPAGKMLSGNSVLVLHFGTGTDSPANNYYHTGGSSDPLTSSQACGVVLKSGGSILDAVATTTSGGIGYTWPAASGVTAAQWTGTIPYGTISSAGVIRIGGYDSNAASDWTYATNTLRQTLGSYSDYYASNSQPAFTYTWSPTAYLSNPVIINPVVSGSPGGNLSYTVTATDPASGCTRDASVSLVAYPLPTATISGTADICLGTSTTLNFAFTGSAPFTYSYTDGTTTYGPYTSASATATRTHTPVGSGSDVITYTLINVSDAHCTGTVSGSAVITFDQVQPTLSGCPGNFAMCNPVTWTPPTASDNCAGVVRTSNWSPGATFPSGVTTVVYTATDANGNSSTCSFQVTLLEPSSMGGISLTSNRPFNNICTGDNITLSMNGVTPSSLGAGAHWKWYSGTCGGTPVPGSTDLTSITVNPTASTSYFVRAEGVCNTTACLSLPVTVSTAPPSTNPGLAYSPAIAYAGATDSIVVNTVPGATFYNWTINGNTNILFNGHAAPYQTSSPKVTVSFISPSTNGNGVGNYHIQFFAGNACGTTNQNIVHIRGTVEAPSSVSGILVACVGQTRTYTVSPVVGAKTYQWSFSSGSGTISGNGTQTVNVTFTSLPAVLCVHGVSPFNSPGPDLCLNVTTVTATPGAISGNAIPCRGGLETYSIASVPGAVSYTWSTNIAGASITPSGTSASVQFPAGIFSGSICVTAYSGCANSTASCLTIVSGTVPPLGTITGTEVGVCGATGVNYQVPSTGATSYSWNVPAGATITSGQGTNSILVDFTSSYAGGNITVVSTNSCGIANGSLAVTGAPPQPVFTTFTGSACVDDVFEYSASSPGATGYNWSASGGNIITTGNADDILVEWTSNGGTVSVTASNSCGNSVPAVLTVTSSCRLAGDKSLADALQAEVFPNPSQGHMTLRYTSPNASPYDLRVRDLTGRIIQHEMLTATEGLNQHDIDLAHVAKGVYMLSLEHEGSSFVVRIVID